MVGEWWARKPIDRFLPVTKTPPAQPHLWVFAADPDPHLVRFQLFADHGLHLQIPFVVPNPSGALWTNTWKKILGKRPRTVSPMV